MAGLKIALREPLITPEVKLEPQEDFIMLENDFFPHGPMIMSEVKLEPPGRLNLKMPEVTKSPYEHLTFLEVKQEPEEASTVREEELQINSDDELVVKFESEEPLIMPEVKLEPEEASTVCEEQLEMDTVDEPAEVWERASPEQGE
jgi:hypothetical protein